MGREKMPQKNCTKAKKTADTARLSVKTDKFSEICKKHLIFFS